MHKSTKDCDISTAVKATVWGRDHGQCILCESAAAKPNAHYIPRSQLGLGIEQNIVTLCWKCHMDYDGVDRVALGTRIKKYLDDHYPGFPNEARYYKKFNFGDQV